MLGKKIKQIRKQNSLTQDEFGKKLVHTKSTISKWENNQATPDAATIKKITTLFNVDINYLLDDNVVKEDIKTIRRKTKRETKKIDWEKCNYNNISNLPDIKWKKIVVHIVGALFVFGGFAFWVPMFVKQNNYTSQTVILLLVGVALVTIGLFFWIITIGQIRKNNFKLRFNVIFSGYDTYFKLTNKRSNNTKVIYDKDITSVNHLSIRINSMHKQVSIHLLNKQIVTLFGVDNSVLEYIKIMKGGKNE